MDEEGRDVPPGEPGEIVLRAPFVMKGYSDRALTRGLPARPAGFAPATSAASTTEGYLTLVDRTSDMIVTGGYNVYPREVEDALAGHAGGGAGRRGRPARRQMGRDR